jgi:hypothetical protein
MGLRMPLHCDTTKSVQIMFSDYLENICWKVYTTDILPQATQKCDVRSRCLKRDFSQFYFWLLNTTEDNVSEFKWPVTISCQLALEKHRVCGLIPDFAKNDPVDGVRLCLWTAVTNGPIVHSPGDTRIWGPGGVILTGKTKELGDKPVPVPLCPP